MLSFSEYSQFFVGLLAIVDPLGAIPFFLILTAKQSPELKKATIRLTVLSVFGVLLVSFVFGEWILNALGISISAFRCAGGLVLLLMALSMLQSGKDNHGMNPMDDDETIALVPITMPLLAGPGSISTVIVYAHKSHELMHSVIIFLGILSVSICLWLTLIAMPWIAKHITAKSIVMTTRIMGLLLASIAIEFMVGGIKGLFPALTQAT